MQMLPLPQALLVLVFRAARCERRPNLTAFCRRQRCSVLELERAFERLETQELITFYPEGERLTLRGLAVAAALAKQSSQQQRPLAHCKALAA